MRMSVRVCLAIIATVAISPAMSRGQNVQVRVTVENLAPANSVAFSALRLGFGNGTFDSFNAGQAAFLLGQPDISTAPAITIAEGGLGTTWFPAFAAAEPNATLGSVAAAPFVPGAMAFSDFSVNASVNPFFTFGAMVVPSNDFFIGNDSPTQYRLFNANGSLAINSITLTGSDVWNAGSETENPLNAAFLQIGTNSLRENQNGVVTSDFNLATPFNGLTTGAGYVFNSQLTADLPIYRISFSAVPEPASVGMLVMCGLAITIRRRGGETRE